MPIIVKPKISRIEVEFPAAEKVRVRIYGFKQYEEEGEDPVAGAQGTRQAIVPATQSDVASWLAFVLAQAKIKFGWDTLEYDFPEPEPEPEPEP